MEDKPPHHTAAHWATRRRDLEEHVVRAVTDRGDSWEFSTESSLGFIRSKNDVPREFKPGDTFELETVNLSQITGMRADGEWIFRMTDEDLAAQARKWSEDYERRLSEELDANHRKYSRWESDLPPWLQARVQRFHKAGGVDFKREGWGYELVICQLADLLDQGRDDDADKLADERGASGNQYGCAKALAALRKTEGDEVGVLLPAGLSPITGSVDYS